MKLSIAALITNYNTWDLTRKCVREIQRYSQGNLAQILVMDDASKDAPPDYLTTQAKIIRNSHNQGLIANTNLGFSNLTEDIIILFDSDAYPLMNFTEIVREKFTNNAKLGALGFQTVDEQGNQTASWQTPPDIWGLLLGQKLEMVYRKWFNSHQKKPILLYQCAVAIRKQAFDEISGFDENFDWLDADLDFSWRLHKAGWQVKFEPKLQAFHQGGGTFQATSARVLRHHKNRWQLLAKHGMLVYPMWFKLALFTRHLFELIILQTAGKLIFRNPSFLQDKLHSRKTLLSTVWRSYGNEF